MAVSADGKLLVGAYLSDLKIKDLIRVRAKQTMPTKQTISTPRNVISAVAISPDSSLSLSGHHNGEINLWNTHSGQNQGILKGHSDTVKALAIAPNGKVLASGGNERVIKLWDLATQTEICTLTGHTEYVKALAFSPDSKLLVSGSLDKTLKIWGAA